MMERYAALAVALGIGASIGACDIIIYAKATAPLVAPMDSLCLEEALFHRFGDADEWPATERRNGRWPASFTLYFDRTSFTQTYADSSFPTLLAAKPVGAGIFSALWPPHARIDSVGHSLGEELLALRNTCGGQTPFGVEEVTVAR